jgi:hypothetical protein
MRSFLSAVEYLCLGVVLAVTYWTVKRGLGWHADAAKRQPGGGGGGGGGVGGLGGSEPLVGGGGGFDPDYDADAEMMMAAGGVGAGGFGEGRDGVAMAAPRMDDDERALEALMEQARKQAADRGASDLLEVMAMAQVN